MCQAAQSAKATEVHGTKVRSKEGFTARETDLGFYYFGGVHILGREGIVEDRTPKSAGLAVEERKSRLQEFRMGLHVVVENQKVASSGASVVKCVVDVSGLGVVGLRLHAGDVVN